MSSGYKIPFRWFILVSLIVLTVVSGFTLVQYSTRTLDTIIGTQELVGTVRGGADLSLELISREMLRIAETLSSIPPIQNTIIEAYDASGKDGPEAKEMLASAAAGVHEALSRFPRHRPRKDAAGEKPNLSVYLFTDKQTLICLQDGHISYVRPNDLVKSVFTSGAMNKGFVLEGGNSGLKAAAPVFSDTGKGGKRKVIGVIEVSQDVNTTLDNLKTLLATDFEYGSAILIRNDGLSGSDNVNATMNESLLAIGNINYMVYAGYKPFFKGIAEDEGCVRHILSGEECKADNISGKLPGDDSPVRTFGKTYFIDKTGGCFIRDGERLFGVLPLPLRTFSMEAGKWELKKGFEREPPEAVILMWSDFSKIHGDMRTALIKYIYHGLVAYLILMAILYAAWRYATKKLQLLIDEQAGELHKAEQSFRKLYENALLGIFRAVDGRFISINPAGAQILGYDSLEEVIEDENAIANMYAHPQDRELFLTRLKAEKYLNKYELQIRRPNGEMCWLLLNVRLTQDDEGRDVIEGFAFDMTAERHARDELKNSQEKLQLALEASNADLWELDLKSGRYIVPPYRLYASFGYPPDETPCCLDDERNYCNQDDFILAGRNGVRHIRGETPGFYAEMRVRTAGGSWAWVALKGRVSRRDENDKPLSMIGLSIDITERKNAEEEARRIENKYRRIVETANEGYVHTDCKNLIQEVNRTLEVILGYDRSELIGKPLSVIKDDARLPVCELAPTLPGMKHDHIRGTRECLYSARNGEGIPMLENTSPLLDEQGNCQGHVSFITDISDRKKAIEALKQAKALAEEANRAKSEFLARMSHEIRTPLNAVIGMTYLTMQTELTPKQHDYLGKISSSADALMGIINDILDFSKIEAGKMELESVEFQLDHVLENLANIITVKAEEKDLEVLFLIAKGVPRTLVGDPLRLGQILVNLSNNAIKFTEQGEIVISVELLEESNGEVQLLFRVKDTGIGLDPGQAEMLFQPFKQADGSITRVYGGTGLGLTICKRLVEMMRGRVSVQSEPNLGSTFSFTVRLGRVGETQSRVHIPPSDLYNLKVLLIDDNPTALRIIKETLESFTFRVDTSSSGEKALDMLLNASDNPEDDYKLIIVDWKMPGWDGIETLEHLSGVSRLSRVPKLLMTGAFMGDEMLSRARRAGVTSFLMKPVNRSMLFDGIMETFGREIVRRKRGRYPSDALKDSLGAIRGARILLVEDNEFNRQVATELLEQAGLVVTPANGGAEGIEKFRQDSFDLVLMDIQMPGIDGYETARRIITLGRNVRIVALTAHAMAEDRQSALNSGMVDLITKPIDPTQLYNTLLRWIEPGERQLPESSVQTRNAEAADGVLTLPELPGINTAAGLKNVGGNLRLYLKLLRDFPADYADDVRKITQTARAGDFKTARRIAHTMKSVAGGIGAEDLRMAAKDLEEAFERGEFDFSGTLMREFEDNLLGILHSLSLLPAAEAKAEALHTGLKPADKDEIARILSELLELTKKGKPAKCLSILNSLESMDLSDRLSELAEIRHNLENYLFRDASGLIETALKRLNDKDHI